MLVRLDEAISPYMATGEVQDNTAKKYREILRLFVSTHGYRHLNQFTEKTVKRWLVDLGKRCASSNTQNLNHCVVEGFLAFLGEHCSYEHRTEAGEVELREVPDLRYALGKRPPLERHPYSLEQDEVRTLLEALPKVKQPERALAIVSLMLYPGLRACEVSRMHRDDYDGVWVKPRGKGGMGAKKDDEVPVGPQCHQAVERWLDVRGRRSGPMFPSRFPDESLKPETISQYVKDWMKAAKIKTRRGDGRSAHGLRHTCATDAIYVNGQPLATVQKLMRHKQITTTTIYVKVRDAELLKCVDRPGYTEPPATAA